MAAVVFITSKPVDAFLKGKLDPGFKFLPVSYDKRFEDYYVPATLEAAEYPALIKPGERIATIAVPTVLIAFNWPAGSNRYQRVARFTEYLFSRIDKLQVLASTPSGRRSISRRLFRAWRNASRRRRNGLIVRRASRRKSNEDRCDLRNVAALASASALAQRWAPEA